MGVPLEGYPLILKNFSHLCLLFVILSLLIMILLKKVKWAGKFILSFYHFIIGFLTYQPNSGALKLLNKEEQDALFREFNDLRLAYDQLKLQIAAPFTTTLEYMKLEREKKDLREQLQHMSKVVELQNKQLDQLLGGTEYTEKNPNLQIQELKKELERTINELN